MNKYLFLTLLALSISVHAQNVKSGIGKRDPQQTLQVTLPAGTASSSSPVGSTGVKLVTPTIKVEGLNSTNNLAQPADSNSLKRVYANQNGDLVLVKSNLEMQKISQDVGDAIPSKSITATGANALESVELKSVDFTLTYPSVVYFSATFQAKVQESVSGSPATITDRVAKLYGAYFQFSSTSSGISTTAAFGNNKQSYANIGPTAVTDFMLSPRAKLLLPAGSYTVKLYGQLLSSSTGNRLSITFGGPNTDESFFINATPIQYQ